MKLLLVMLCLTASVYSSNPESSSALDRMQALVVSSGLCNFQCPTPEQVYVFLHSTAVVSLMTLVGAAAEAELRNGGIFGSQDTAENVCYACMAGWLVTQFILETRPELDPRLLHGRAEAKARVNNIAQVGERVPLNGPRRRFKLGYLSSLSNNPVNTHV